MTAKSGNIIAYEKDEVNTCYYDVYIKRDERSPSLILFLKLVVPLSGRCTPSLQNKFLQGAIGKKS